jgi:hypothetical protein
MQPDWGLEREKGGGSHFQKTRLDKKEKKKKMLVERACRNQNLRRGVEERVLFETRDPIPKQGWRTNSKVSSPKHWLN